MVEHLICNQGVAGSSPIASSREEKFFSPERYPSGQRGRAVNPLAQPTEVRILPSPPFFPRKAGIAQWPEHQPSKLRVAGSSPVSRSSLRAHVAQLVEHILGKDEVHRFDPGRGLHVSRAQRVKEFGEPQAAACVYLLDLGSGRPAAAIKAEELPRGPGALRGNLFLEKRDGEKEV